jgi:hypothetical protein
VPDIGGNGTTSTFDVVPEDNPVVSELKRLFGDELKRLFGDHTYFVDPSGLNIVEPGEANSEDVSFGVVVNIADWADKGVADARAARP